MTTKARRHTLKLVPNSVPLEAEMVFDSPRTGENRYGPWYAFTMRLLAPYPIMGGELPVGEEVTYFADNEMVADRLKAYTRGQQFMITATKAPGAKYMDIEVRPRTPAPSYAREPGEDDLPLDEQPIYGGPSQPNANGTPDSGAPGEAEGLSRIYAQAMKAGYDALHAGLALIEKSGADPMRVAALEDHIDLEAIQRVAATFFIEAAKQRRTEQISRERGR